MSASERSRRAAVIVATAVLSVICVLPASGDAPKSTFGEVVAQMYADQTFVVSPTSLNAVLHIAKDASQGRTASEIEPLLFEDDIHAETTIDNGVKLVSSSGVWISSRYPGNAEFNSLAMRKYGASVSRVNFANGEGEKAVNGWIARLSGGDLSGAPLDALTLFVIANVQVFEGKWEKPFDPAMTRSDVFHGRSADEPVHMMASSASCEYEETSLGQTVALDYAGSYRMLLFLPRNPRAHPLESFLHQESDLKLYRSFLWVELPRMHENMSEYLTRPLVQLGMRTAFGPNADFSPMLGVRNHGDAIMFQNVDIKIDEQGTVAKAATEMVQKLQALVRPKIVRFDRPFAFAIQRTGDHPVTLFEGQILDVKDKAAKTR